MNFAVHTQARTTPTGAHPPIPEWAGHYWYVLRLAALQASPELTDGQRLAMVQYFHGFSVALPCKECTEHFVEHWVTDPFTREMAGDAVAAGQWVEQLKAAIEGRVKARAGANAGAATSSASMALAASVLSPAPTPVPPAVARNRFSGARSAAVTPLAAAGATQAASGRQSSVFERQGLGFVRGSGPAGSHGTRGPVSAGRAAATAPARAQNQSVPRPVARPLQYTGGCASCGGRRGG